MSETVKVKTIRTRHEISQQRFDLYTDDPHEKNLDDLLKSLANNGRKRAWIVRALMAALKERGSNGKTE